MFKALGEENADQKKGREEGRKKEREGGKERGQREGRNSGWMVGWFFFILFWFMDPLRIMTAMDPYPERYLYVQNTAYYFWGLLGHLY